MVLDFGIYRSITTLHGSFGVWMSNVHPGCAFNMELKRLKRDFFLSIIYLFLPRGIKVGSAVF